MLRSLSEAKRYFSKDDSMHEDPNKAKNITVMSMLVKESVEMIIDQVEKIGFSGVEMIEKAEVFLRITTPSSNDRLFFDVLQALRDVDSNFESSSLHFSLNTLRSLNTGKFNISLLDFVVIEGLDAQELKKVATELSFFCGYLSEVIIKYLETQRRDPKNLRIKAQDLKNKFENSFDEMVLSLINKISRV